MFKKICKLVLIGWLCFSLSGCAAIGTALGAAAAYGIYYGLYKNKK